MLKIAKQYEGQLQDLLYETVDDPYYNWYYPSTIDYIMQLVGDDTWHLQYVSVDSENKVIGFFHCDINVHQKYASGLEIVNYTKEPNLMFSQDLKMFIQRVKDRGMKSITAHIAAQNENFPNAMTKRKTKMGLNIRHVGYYLNTQINRKGEMGSQHIYQLTFKDLT